MKMLSLFDGIGGFPLAGSFFGIESVAASEVEPFCIRVTQERFPGMKHLGSVTGINGAETEPVDIITFGSPCFPAGTLVNTLDGFKPIEKVRVTDKVLTHTGKYKQVLNSQYTGEKQLMRLHAMGVHQIDATPNHLFYTLRKDGSVSWVRMDELTKEDFIAAPVNKECENPMQLTPQECWLIGRYIADGYTRNEQRPNRPRGSRFAITVFCIGRGKEEEFESKLIGLKHGKSSESRNTMKFTIHGHRLAGLCEACGHGAATKQFPPFILNLPCELLAEVVNGYMSGDGSLVHGLRKATTVSESLAYSLAQAVAKVFKSHCRLYRAEVPKTTVIEGRVVNQLPQWQVVYALEESERSKARCDGTYVWLPVRSTEHLEGKHAVYDLTVAEDHSFCVQNIAVHNCQDLSVAGKQLGIHDGERSNLFFEAVRIIKEMREHDRAVNGRAGVDVRPRFAVWENVPGAFSSNKGEDFKSVLEALCSVCDEAVSVPRPEGGGWSPAGCVVGKGYSIAWRVLDAQYYGVPQRRKRIYLVADFGSERAGEIQFVGESMPWNSPQSREARESAARYVKGCAE